MFDILGIRKNRRISTVLFFGMMSYFTSEGVVILSLHTLHSTVSMPFAELRILQVPIEPQRGQVSAV